MKTIQSKVLLATLATFSSGVFADINLYGKVAVGLGDDQFQNTTVPGAGSVQDYGSYFGIRGTDLVYGHTAVIWQVEQYLDIASGQSYYNSTGGGMIAHNPSSTLDDQRGYMKNNTNTLASSETYLGLQGDWGRFRMGNLSNYVRSNMGNTIMFNCANGVNCLGNLTRTSRLIPTSVRYDTPTFGGFNAMVMYGFDTNGTNGMTGVSMSNNYGAGLNGVYSGGIIAGGIGYAVGNWQVNLGTMIWTQVGSYSTGVSGLSIAQPDSGISPAYSYAYANTLELGYNDPDGLIANLAFQTTSGMAWNSWAVSGGTLGVTFNQGYQSEAQMLNTNAQLQTLGVTPRHGENKNFHLSRLP
ncbi:MAG: porin, partial [Burkholderiales bacterium]|nr:porin [Burkholderiales bacterium]